MSKEKKSEEKPKGLSQLGTVFEVPDVTMDAYISQTNLKKLSEKFGQKINLVALGFLLPEAKSSIFFIINPEDNTKSVMIATEQISGKNFYDALVAVQKEK